MNDDKDYIDGLEGEDASDNDDFDIWEDRPWDMGGKTFRAACDPCEPDVECAGCRRYGLWDEPRSIKPKMRPPNMRDAARHEAKLDYLLDRTPAIPFASEQKIWETMRDINKLLERRKLPTFDVESPDRFFDFIKLYLRPLPEIIAGLDLAAKGIARSCAIDDELARKLDQNFAEMAPVPEDDDEEFQAILAMIDETSPDA